MTDRVLKWLVVVAVGAAATLVALMVIAPTPAEPAARLQYWEFYFDAFKTIVVGAVVGVLSVVIPHRLNEAKYTFERLKESRLAYSEAHTGITYLEYRLAVLDYGAAIALIEAIHVKKHMAETYDELALHLSRKGQSVPEWSDHLAAKLSRLTKEVGLDYVQWTNAAPQERLARLLRASEEFTRPPQ